MAQTFQEIVLIYQVKETFILISTNYEGVCERFSTNTLFGLKMAIFKFIAPKMAIFKFSAPKKTITRNKLMLLFEFFGLK